MLMSSTFRDCLGYLHGLKCAQLVLGADATCLCNALWGRDGQSEAGDLRESLIPSCLELLLLLLLGILFSATLWKELSNGQGTLPEEEAWM